jgi:high affinity Mn2+ porin
MTSNRKTIGVTAACACAATTLAAADLSTNSSASPSQKWNVHVQNTDIVQGYPGFPAQYSGPNSLPSGGETRETVSLDLMAGVHLWPGAEAHVDGMMWQGLGLAQATGIEAFPNGDAIPGDQATPNVNLVRVFLRQTIGFGGPQQDVPDDGQNLAGKEDISRLTITLGRFSVKDIFDNNQYADDPRKQFMNWGLMANEGWDFPQDALGYISGLALELNQPQWTLRYGFFQVPRVSGGVALDMRVLQAWGMVTELERRYALDDHSGAIRFLAYLNHAHMGNYQQAAADSPPGAADIAATRAYRYKYGFELNWEQEICTNVGVFSRLGWSDGHSEAWSFTDVDDAASLGLSFNGTTWARPGDTFGVASVFSAISKTHQQFFEDGGTGILAGDGALNYGWEKSLETYYDFRIWQSFHGALDYQFVTDPAFNRDRGPVSVFAARLHWQF